MWYMIDGFNGYEINKEGQVRSMKMMNADPGHLLKRRGDYYILSNNNNERIRISYKELLDIVFNSGKPLRGRQDDYIYLGSRNKVFDADKVSMDFSKYITKED